MAAAVIQASHSIMPENVRTSTVTNVTLITSHLEMTPTYNHDLKGAIYTEEEHCSHTHSIPQINNTGYIWK